MSSIITITTVLGVVTPKLYAKFEEKIKILQTIKQEIEKTQSNNPMASAPIRPAEHPAATAPNPAVEKPK